MADQENSLVKAMREMKAGNDNALKNAFVKELLFSKLNVPVIIDPAPENGVIKENSVISYMSLRDDNDGKKLLLTFTSREEYGKFMKKGMATHIMLHPYSEVRALVINKKFDGFIIDPAGENVAVTQDLMEKIAQVAAPLQVKTEKVHVENGEAALKPAGPIAQEFLDTLKKYLETQDNIKTCYLMETLRDGEKDPTLVVVIDFEGEMPKVFNGIANAVRKHLKPNESFGMMSVKDPMAAAAVLETEPFYTK